MHITNGNNITFKKFEGSKIFARVLSDKPAEEDDTKASCCGFALGGQNSQTLSRKEISSDSLNIL